MQPVGPSAATAASAHDASREAAVDRMLRRMTRPWLFRLFLIRKMPIAWIAGLRLRRLDRDSCTASMPYRWLSQNPFRSIYFATQAMAAELSTGALAILAVTGARPSVSMLITGLEAEYSKKADRTVYFHCDDGARLLETVDRAMAGGEGESVTVETVGRYADGTEVSRFRFTWSFKPRT